MSDATVDELTDILRNLREHAKLMSELGVENLSLDFAGDAGITSAPALVGAQASAAAEPAAKSETPAPIKPAVVEPSQSLFGDAPGSQPGLARSTETLEQVWADIGDCTRCALCEGRTQVVNTHGDRNARLMFVGEAPGADEDAQGKPFVGRAGQLLTKMIEAMGMKRDEVIIGNVNRCRPPGNRQPTLEEAAICRPFLFREIAAIQPEIIVVMGNTALRNLLEVREGITRVRGKFQDFRGIKVMPTFHPAYLLRDPSKKRETWEDLKMVRDYLDQNPPKTRG